MNLTKTALVAVLVVAGASAFTSTAKAQAQASTLIATPQQSFNVNNPPYTYTIDSVGSSSTNLPGAVTFTNAWSGIYSGQYFGTLNVLAAEPSVNLTNQSYVYAIAGAGIIDNNLVGYMPNYVWGPGITINNYAALALSNPAGSTLPSYYGFHATSYSVFQAFSIGANGFIYNAKDVTTANYSGGEGGPVNILNSGAIAISGTASGSGSGLPWAPYLTAMYAASIGGTGVGGKANDNDYNGAGGDGGPIAITTSAGSQITVQGTGNSSLFMNGITALSNGGMPGCRCEGDTANQFGPSGSGGAVTIAHAGSIYSSATESIGIAATSIGGAGGLLPGSGVGAGDGGTSGPGGAVGVTLQTGSTINMAGVNGIGVVAISAVGNSNNSNATAADISGGSVTVTLNAGSSVTTGNASNLGVGRFAIGVLAVSSGTANIFAPFNDSGLAIGGTGDSGTVTVSNAGTITSSGQMAIGIAALSLGGTGIITNASYGSLSNLGSNATGQIASGGGVSVTNSGGITTNGASAFGIVAISAGGGGLASADAGPTPGSSAANNGFNGGLVVGGAAGNSANGGPVTVTNTGTITTGDGQGGGKAAIGIIAQSIGGGGGSSGGTNPAAFVGDSAGGGGSGGSVTVTNGGNVVTNDDGALGILAQSIGGGGGNGGNAAGVFVAVGGAGGSGGAGGKVGVTLNGGLLKTSGDFAAGIIAQSVGGGGGNGGYGTSGGFFIDTAIGGTGGSGGNGGAVTLTTSQTVMTSGQDSLGILAQSVGGGGGNGGAATAYSVGAAFSASIALGGTGGGGGSASAVTINNNYHISTTGPDSIGIVAQSIGGGGGTGGASTAKSLAIGVPDIPTISFSAALGASGGGGGNGGAVTINNAGQIITTGDGAHGLLAQSIGAGGGNGGDSTAASRAIESATVTAQLSVALGATGGTAGNGGPVTVIAGASASCENCFSQTYTGGQNAAGIAAQSIGGGGGNSTAGNAGTGAPNLGGTTGNAFSGALSLGASGGSGGSGNTVSVTNGVLNGIGNSQNLISTTGSGSPGILAQSIGGGGGNAGGGSAGGSENTVSINVTLGGNAGSGSTGGLVTVSNFGVITTIGGDAVGILAQSIGGGGGVAGTTDASASISTTGQIENLLHPPSSGSAAGNLAIGGSGGSGAYANTVTVSNYGSIATTGERAYGIEAQSIGGGGGNGGIASSASSSSINSTYSGSITVGGSGGGSGNGGNVNVTNGGPIQTLGYNAHGILAQAIGGGGGVGGDGSVSASTTVGIGVGVSGNGGSSGTGGTINVTTLVGGTIATLGDDASGILAQSIGGGGGTATAGCTNSASAGIASTKATACFGNFSTSDSKNGPAAFLPHADLNLNIGGNASASGNGNGVTITVNDAIVTAGARSMGIIAQSIGGGGGYAVAAAQNISSTGLTNSPGSNGGTGGPVTVNLAASGSIQTSGAGAWGILAQSIGGGGGLSGDPSLALNIPASNTLSQAGIGNGFANTVAVNIAGNITTTGANAHGIFAQAIGGSGGVVAGCCQSTTAMALVGNSAQIRSGSNATYWGQGGAINISQAAGSTINAGGPGSIGIFAQSSGNQVSQNPITINIAGLVNGGTGPGSAGILVSGGISAGGSSAATVQNAVTIQPTGVVGSMAGIYGVAILATDSITNVVNNGAITGNVDLGTGSATGGNPGTFINNLSLNAGSTLVTSLLTNAGVFNIGLPGIIQTTVLTGGLTQTSTGRLGVTIDALTGTGSLLEVSGAASVDGTVVPTAIALLSGPTTIVTASSLSSVAIAQSSLLFNWGLTASSTSLAISPSSNFTPAGVTLTGTQAAAAGYLTRIWNARDPALATTFAAFSRIQNGSEYTPILDAYSPKATMVQANALANSEGMILGAALSCPVFVSSSVLLGEDNCVWAKTTGQQTDQNSGIDRLGYQVAAVTYRMGAQHEVAPNWFLGGSLAAGQSWATMDGGSSGNGQAFDGSVALKHTLGPWLFAVSSAVATGFYSNDRAINLPGTNALLKSNSSIFLVGARFRSAYEITFESWYVRPYGDFDVVYTNTPGFQESGQTNFALNVHGASKTSAVISPMVEFGGRVNTGSGMILRPYAAVGISFLPNSTRAIDASLVEASAADGTFRTYLKVPDVLGKFEVGLQIYREGGFEVKAEYGLKAGNAYLSQSGGARVAYHF